MVVIIIPLTAGVNAYNFRVDWDIAGYRELYNVRTGNAVVLSDVETQNTLCNFVVPLWLTTLLRNDVMGLRVTYQGAGGGGIATNCWILGAALVWP
jgi:hypothetical protein